LGSCGDCLCHGSVSVWRVSILLFARGQEPDLFKSVTGLTVKDFDLLVSLGVFNSTHMNQAVFAFRRHEDSSLSYTGIESHPRLRRYGLYDTVVAIDQDLV
jgi:hypothetical protein